MNNDDLEQKLRRQPLRELPREWRAEILAAAGAPVSDPARPRAVEEVPMRRAGGRRSAPVWWFAWLNPSRAGWAALGAVWMLIAVLHFASDGADAASGTSTVAGTTPAEWLARRQLMAELIGPAEPAEPAAVTRPRSERRSRATLHFA